jgi:hypothetical protein
MTPVRPATPSQPADLFVHEAGHAVIAWELGITIEDIRFSTKNWSGLMHFVGGMYRFEGDLASERAREAAEKDMLIYHAGLVAQRLFHYDSALGPSVIDVRGLINTAKMVEDDVNLIDAWSDYIEERVRVMLCRPATWQRVIAFAPEIARRLYLRGDEVAAFLAHVDVAQAVSPRERRWNRAAYAFGKGIDALSLSARTRGCLDRAGIATIAELLTYSASDLRSTVWNAGPKTVAEVEAELATLGLRLAEERRIDREMRVERTQREERQWRGVGAMPRRSLH